MFYLIIEKYKDKYIRSNLEHEEILKTCSKNNALNWANKTWSSFSDAEKPYRRVLVLYLQPNNSHVIYHSDIE